MKIKPLSREIEIQASIESIWQVLWDKEYYKNWASAYMEGSHYSGELSTGAKVRFLDADNNGMESEVASFIENQEIVFNHLHEIQKGKLGRSLKPMQEKYYLEERAGKVLLQLSLDMPEEFWDEITDATEKALRIIKTLAEEK